ncbi:lipoprotein bor [Pasteurellaceae bacterium Macca]|nr:lipoprotein bor [Pasteurellaceae bacterium Macca]
MKKLMLLAVAGFLMAGCSTQTYIVSQQVGKVEPTYEDMQTFFVQGIAQQKEVNASEVCKGSENVTKVQTKMSFLNGFLGTLSQGIYTPRDIKVYCK